METAFLSEERFTTEGFRCWLDARPPSDCNRYELIRGRIVVSPPARWPHGRVEARLAALLEAHVRPRQLGIVLTSSGGYELPSGETVAPDVSFISTERLAAGPPPQAGEFLRVPPNLVVEILSPSTERRDRTEKREIYEANAVDEYWLIDQRRSAVTVFHLERGRYGEGVEHTHGRVESRVLPELAITLDDVFAIFP